VVLTLATPVEEETRGVDCDKGWLAAQLPELSCGRSRRSRGRAVLGYVVTGGKSG
jgi:hypothetical protein